MPPLSSHQELIPGHLGSRLNQTARVAAAWTATNSGPTRSLNSCFSPSHNRGHRLHTKPLQPPSPQATSSHHQPLARAHHQASGHASSTQLRQITETTVRRRPLCAKPRHRLDQRRCLPPDAVSSHQELR
ncbi:hypothetical protein Droror1_Dr00023348 [Drosera rotundifolia]